MSTFLAGVATAAAAATVAMVIALVVRRRVTFDRGRDTAPLGTILTIVTGLHSVLVVFVLVGVIQSAGATRQAAAREADSLVAAVWAADAFPEASRAEVGREARAYAEIVINREWPLLRDGKPVKQDGWIALQRLRHAVVEASVSSEVQLDRRSEASDRVVDAYLARQARLTTGTDQIPPVLWLVLAMGAVASVALPYLFGGGSAGSYIFLVATMAALMAMLLFAIFQLQNPFSDSGGVTPDAFRSALDRLG